MEDIICIQKTFISSWDRAKIHVENTAVSWNSIKMDSRTIIIRKWQQIQNTQGVMSKLTAI